MSADPNLATWLSGFATGAASTVAAAVVWYLALDWWHTRRRRRAWKRRNQDRLPQRTIHGIIAERVEQDGRAARRYDRWE